MTPALVLCGATLPATPEPTLQLLKRVEEQLLELPQIPLRTEHVIHGGMYARTIRLAPHTMITGALIKVPTMLIVQGHAFVLLGDGWAEVEGYNVVAASKGRKQMFVAVEETIITMLFPTKATNIEEAEEEFTDEHDLLNSRSVGENVITITGE